MSSGRIGPHAGPACNGECLCWHLWEACQLVLCPSSLLTKSLCFCFTFLCSLLLSWARGGDCHDLGVFQEWGYVCLIQLPSHVWLVLQKGAVCPREGRQAGCNPVILSLLIAATPTITYVLSLSLALLPALLPGVTWEQEVLDWMQISSMAQVSRRSPSLSSSGLLPCSFFLQLFFS